MKGKIFIEDLRIGNYVHDQNGYICQIGMIGPSNAIGFMNEGSSVVDASCIADIKPVEIKIPRLAAMGFNVVSSRKIQGSWLVMQKDDFYVVFIETGRYAIYYENNPEAICYLNYIHQLQNIYYSITFLDLTFKK